MMKKVWGAIKDPVRILQFCSRRGWMDWMKDETYLKIVFKARMGKELNLEAPKTFNEKLQWLKLHYRDPLHTRLVDKYEVRSYIAETLGEEYLIPLLGVWDNPADIDYDSLPDQFVLKCTHDSGSVVICRDKAKLDKAAAAKKLARGLKNNGYNFGREWPYKDVKPRIIAEKYMVDDETGELRDYKFFCFDGKVDCVMLCMERATSDTKFYFFDRDWNLLRYNIRGKNAPEGFTVLKPSNMDEMFALAQKLSAGFPYSRVDLYSVNGKSYFGEITFFPNSGFDANLLPETDLRWGEMINLRATDLEVGIDE